MDVVALAQHGVEYAVATLGTATTPMHVQKLFRLTDTVVFCFDGDNAGRKAAWRALENTLPVLADGKNARVPVPARRRGPRRLRAQARPGGVRAGAAKPPCRCPSSCWRNWPRGIRRRRRRAAPRWSRPRARYLAQIDAPVLAAILRRRLSELSGLPEAELRGLLDCPPPAAAGRAPRPARDDARPAPRGAGCRANVRRPPSLTRELIQGLLLQPALARSLEFPRPDDGTPDGAALVALVDYCAAADGRTDHGGRPPALRRTRRTKRVLAERARDGRGPRPRRRGHAEARGPRGSRALVAAGAAQRHAAAARARRGARPPRRSSGCASSSTCAKRRAPGRRARRLVRGRVLARRKGPARGII